MAEVELHDVMRALRETRQLARANLELAAIKAFKAVFGKEPTFADAGPVGTWPFDNNIGIRHGNSFGPIFGPLQVREWLLERLGQMVGYARWASDVPWWEETDPRGLYLLIDGQGDVITWKSKGKGTVVHMKYEMVEVPG